MGPESDLGSNPGSPFTGYVTSEKIFNLFDIPFL